MVDNLQRSSIHIDTSGHITVKGHVHSTETDVSWDTANCVFYFKVSCGLAFVGQTSRSLKDRFADLRSAFKKGKSSRLYDHFRNPCNLCTGKHTLYVLEDELDRKQLNPREAHYTELLDTVEHGLNEPTVWKEASVKKAEKNKKRRDRHVERMKDLAYKQRRRELLSQSQIRRKGKVISKADRKAKNKKRRALHKIRMADAVKRKIIQRHRRDFHRKSMLQPGKRMKQRSEDRRRYRRRNPPGCWTDPDELKRNRNLRRKIKRHVARHGFCSCT